MILAMRRRMLAATLIWEEVRNMTGSGVEGTGRTHVNGPISISVRLPPFLFLLLRQELMEVFPDSLEFSSSLCKAISSILCHSRNQCRRTWNPIMIYLSISMLSI